MENEKIYGVEAEQPTAEQVLPTEEITDDSDIKDTDVFEEAETEEEIGVDLESTEEEIAEEEPPKKQVEKQLTQADIDKIVQKRIEEQTKAKQKAKIEVDEYEKLLKGALKGLINDGESAKDAAIRIAAENEGVTVDEYKTRIKEQSELKEYKQSKEADAAAQAKAEHLAEIKKLYPDLKADSIEQIPNFEAYKALMIANDSLDVKHKLTPSMAFAAANIGNLKNLSKASDEEFQKQYAINASKEHLKATGTRTVASTLKPIPASEKAEWDSYQQYTGCSDKEKIIAYNKAKQL